MDSREDRRMDRRDDGQKMKMHPKDGNENDWEDERQKM